MAETLRVYESSESPDEDQAARKHHQMLKNLRVHSYNQPEMQQQVLAGCLGWDQHLLKRYHFRA